MTSILQIAFKWYNTSCKHSYLWKDSPTVVMLYVFLRDKNAFGTARSSKELKLASWPAPHFTMGRDQLWDSEEYNIAQWRN